MTRACIVDNPFSRPSIFHLLHVHFNHINELLLIRVIDLLLVTLCILFVINIFPEYFTFWIYPTLFGKKTFSSTFETFLRPFPFFISRGLYLGGCFGFHIDFNISLANNQLCDYFVIVRSGKFLTSYSTQIHCVQQLTAHSQYFHSYLYTLSQLIAYPSESGIF